MHADEHLTIVGAGGIGCALGHALSAAGAAVTLVDADADKVAWGRQNGLHVEGQLPLHPGFQLFDDWEPAPGATVFLCTKCYDNAAVLARLPGSIDLIPVQNGFDAAVGRRGAEGIASFVSECMPGQARTRITRKGRLHFQASDSRSRSVARLLQASHLFRVEIVPDILPYKYTKLMYNAAISPLAAAAGLDNGQLLSVKKARQLFFDLLRENYAILHGAGIPLARIGPFHPRTVERILRRRFVAEALAWAFYPGLRGTYCSMSRDLPAGRTEIDYYNRHLIDLAGERPCPLNRMVYGVVKRMERERVQPGLHALAAIA